MEDHLELPEVRVDTSPPRRNRRNRRIFGAALVAATLATGTVVVMEKTSDHTESDAAGHGAYGKRVGNYKRKAAKRAGSTTKTQPAPEQPPADLTDQGGGEPAPGPAPEPQPESEAPAPAPTSPTSGGETGASTWRPSGPAYVVATNGSDSNPGTEDAPWRSIDSAISRLNPGDSLLIRAGDYGDGGGATTININGKNGTPSAPITIAAYPGERPVIHGGGWQVVAVNNSSYLDVRGLEVVGTADQNQAMTNGFEVRDSHHVGVIGNVVHNVGGGGANAIDSNHITIDGNHIYNTSRWNSYQTSGISTFTMKNIGGGDNPDGFSTYIRNNNIHDVKNPDGAVTDGNCIIIDSQRQNGYTGSTYIANNLCRNNGGRGIHVFISDNVVAVNNTVIGNLTNNTFADQGELSAVTATNVTFRNNIVVPARPGRGVRQWDASNIQYENNLFVAPAPEASGPSDKVVADAMLGPDFKPLPGSPAINAGTGTSAPGTDLGGAARSGTPDIGAYEAG